MEQETTMHVSRRQLLTGIATLGTATLANTAFGAPIRYFKPMQIDNPLAYYPNRNWEQVYRDLFRPETSFVFLCAPNDTHNCLLKAYVKNNVIVRIGPTYGYGKATDLYGNTASHRWDPRLCQKGLALPRRIYGDRRLKAPMVRRGFKDWVEAGFPRDAVTGQPDARYFQRGRDGWLRLSWDDAYAIAAKAFENIARTYSGPQGASYLHQQGYDPAMIEALDGAGTQTIKIRGGMAFLGATRIYGMYRFANMLALLDATIRGVGAEQAHGARGWDSYSWHTDLPPGHPMVTGAQTNDFDLFAVEHAKLVLVWGMNWITTKMPDAHWLTEARLKGTKVVNISVEYGATASKADDVLVIRPGTDPALALGLAQVILSRNLFDADFVAKNTDLPFLVRLDTLQPLRPAEIFDQYHAPALTSLRFLKPGEKTPPATQQTGQYAPENLRDDFQPYVIWDRHRDQPVAITRDMWGDHGHALGVSPELRATRTLTLRDGTAVQVRTVFSLTEEYVNANWTPAQTAAITGAPATAIVALAEQIASHREHTLFVMGMGPNQFFNADLKDRAVFLVAALTRNVGFPGGNVGSYAGNYRMAIFSGAPLFGLEDPFHVQTQAGGAITVKKYSAYESLHYYNYGDRPLRVGNTLFTGTGHLPVPTKAMWLNNSNSVIGNVKWLYDVVNNTLPRIEFIAFSDWWWTGSCEYADLVFAVDSWAEFKHLDMTASCTNPFVQVYPTTPLPRVFDTRSDIEVIAHVAKALGDHIQEPRMAEMWKFVLDNQVEVYLQRIIDHTPGLTGYTITELAQKAREGIPALVHNRTYPRLSSYEEVRQEHPWHTKSGRLEFYRPEPEFIDSGENLIVYREPIDSTPYEPNVIVARPHVAIRPKTPGDYALAPQDLSPETRQVRHVLVAPAALRHTAHPLRAQHFTHIYHTPKYRHGAHTMAVDTDLTSVWFGPFGDVYRHDKRMPAVTEGYVDINPLDAKALGINDGDYVWIDADPEDRPYRHWQGATWEYRVARLLLRARYYPGTPRGVARTWHNMSNASFGSVQGQATRPDGLAKNPETNYQAMFRYGGHQSATRAWLKPTLMTDTLVHKDMFGQVIARGFAADIHCPVGAPREAFVRISRAEPGGLDGMGLWRPAALGFRPTVENQAMQAYVQGRFLHVRS